MFKKTSALVLATVIGTVALGSTLAKADYCPTNCYYKTVWVSKKVKVWTDWGPKWVYKKVPVKKRICY